MNEELLEQLEKKYISVEELKEQRKMLDREKNILNRLRRESYIAYQEYCHALRNEESVKATLNVYQEDIEKISNAPKEAIKIVNSDPYKITIKHLKSKRNYILQSIGLIISLLLSVSPVICIILGTIGIIGGDRPEVLLTLPLFIIFGGCSIQISKDLTEYQEQTGKYQDGQIVYQLDYINKQIETLNKELEAAKVERKLLEEIYNQKEQLVDKQTEKIASLFSHSQPVQSKEPQGIASVNHDLDQQEQQIKQLKKQKR